MLLGFPSGKIEDKKKKNKIQYWRLGKTINLCNQFNSPLSHTKTQAMEMLNADQDIGISLMSNQID